MRGREKQDVARVSVFKQFFGSKEKVKCWLFSAQVACGAERGSLLRQGSTATRAQCLSLCEKVITNQRWHPILVNSPALRYTHMRERISFTDKGSKKIKISRRV